MNSKLPRLLPDEPSSNDYLGGAHTRIAQAIVRLFAGSEGGKCIRIDGEWGAGKSTVVRMLKLQLEPDLGPEASGALKTDGQSDYVVFLYDAWVHSGDPLKQAFFRALLDKLQERRWLTAAAKNKDKEKDKDKDKKTAKELTREHWDDQLDLLSSRVKKSQRKETPKFKPDARKIIALIVAFGAGLPYILKLLTYLDQLVGPAAVGLFLIAVAFAVTWLIPETVLNYFLLRNTDTKETETRGDFSSTSIDFQDVFGKLLKACMDGNERRLVVVVDNLDRIGESEIKDVWSLLRSFLDNPSFDGTEWFDRVWVVIPIANAKRLSPSSSEMKASDGVVSTFLEKVFQVSFSLPPPMLQSWKAYMRGRLVDAFGEETANEYEDIQRLYDVYLTESSPAVYADAGDKSQQATTARFVRAHVTPRAIVAFVNELVAVRLERENDPTLPLIAAYQLAASSLQRDSNGLPLMSKHVEAVLKSDKSPEATPDRLPDAWAMLHYHAANLDEASYIVAYPKLDKALLSGDLTTLRTTVSRSTGAPFILERYIHEDLAELSGISLLRAAYSLQSLIESPPDLVAVTPGGRLFSVPMVTLFRETVARRLDDTASLDIGDNLIVEGVSALIEILPSQEAAARRIVELLSVEGINVKPSFANTAFANLPSKVHDWDGWVGSLEKLVQIAAIRQLLISDNSVKVVVSITEEQYVKLLARFGGTDLDWILKAVTPPPGVPLQLDEWFAAYALSGESDDASEQASLYYLRSDETKLKEVAEEIYQRYLRPPSEPSKPHRIPQVNFLAAVSRLLSFGHKGMRELQRPWLNDQFVVQVFEEIASKKDNTSPAKWIALILWILNGELPVSPFVSPTGRTPAQRAVLIAQTKSQSEWLKRVHTFLSAGAWVNHLDEKSYADFVVHAKLFDIFGYGDLLSFASGQLLWSVARSEALYRYLQAEGIDIETFAAQYAKPDEVKQRLVQEYGGVDRS